MDVGCRVGSRTVKMGVEKRERERERDWVCEVGKSPLIPKEGAFSEKREKKDKQVIG